MFKFKPVSDLLEAVIKTGTNQDDSLPQALAVSIISSKDGSPLISSLSTDKSLVELLFFHNNSFNSVYYDYLDQFTSIDFTKINSYYSQRNHDSNIMENTMVTSEYPHTNEDILGMDTEDDAQTATIQEENFNVHSDTQSNLNILSHYAYNCYNLFRKDYYNYLKFNSENANDDTPAEPKNLDQYLKILNDESKELTGLKWFHIRIDDKEVFLHLINNLEKKKNKKKKKDDKKKKEVKKIDEYFIMLTTDLGYPRGLAKLKLEALAKALQVNGF